MSCILSFVSSLEYLGKDHVHVLKDYLVKSCSSSCPSQTVLSAQRPRPSLSPSPGQRWLFQLKLENILKILFGQHLAFTGENGLDGGKGA